MKLLHTSDLRIGMGFPHAYGRALDLRQHRLGSLRRLLSMARRFDALLLCGNTFADNTISENDIHDAAEILKASKIPVYLLPGLTDPLTPDSPYRRHRDLFCEPVTVIENEEPIVLGKITLYPYPTLKREAPSPVWPTISDEIAIGAICRRPDELDSEHPFHYLALGGITNRLEKGALSWPGAPESVNFGEGKGKLVQLTVDEESVRVGQAAFGELDWLEWDRELKDTSWLLEKLDGLKNREFTLLNLRLRGELSWLQCQEIEAALRQASKEFYFLQVDNLLKVRPEGPNAVSYHNRLLQSILTQLDKSDEKSETTIRQAALLLNEIVSRSGQDDLN